MPRHPPTPPCLPFRYTELPVLVVFPGLTVFDIPPITFSLPSSSMLSATRIFSASSLPSPVQPGFPEFCFQRMIGPFLENMNGYSKPFQGGLRYYGLRLTSNGSGGPLPDLLPLGFPFGRSLFFLGKNLDFPLIYPVCCRLRGSPGVQIHDHGFRGQC
jgi:hypothetical protein